MEFAPFQRHELLQKGKGIDPLCNTIESDSVYLKFQAGEDEIVNIGEEPAKQESKDTPLLEALRRKYQRRGNRPNQILSRQLDFQNQSKSKKSRKKKQQQQFREPTENITKPPRSEGPVKTMLLQMRGKPISIIKNESRN